MMGLKILLRKSRQPKKSGRLTRLKAAIIREVDQVDLKMDLIGLLMRLQKILPRHNHKRLWIE